MSSPPVEHSQEYLDANKGPVILGISITVVVLSTIFVLARLFTRHKIMGKLHLDDWLTFVAMILQWFCVGFGIAAVYSGNGRHFDTLKLHQQQNAILYTILGFPFGVMAFGLPKLAVAALLTRLMNPSKLHRILLWSLPSACIASLIACVVVLFAQCSPAKAQWDFSITDKTCWSPFVLVDLAIFAGALSAFTDLYLAIYPATVLWTLHINLRKKIALSVALGIGSIATIVAIYKCTRLPSLASADFSYDTSDLVIWTVLEASTIIIACCIPVLQPLIDLLLGKRAFGSSPEGYKNYGTSGAGRQPSSGIELENSRQKRSNTRSISNSKYMGTLGQQELDSQESILGHGSSKAEGGSSHVGDSV